MNNRPFTYFQAAGLAFVLLLSGGCSLQAFQPARPPEMVLRYVDTPHFSVSEMHLVNESGKTFLSGELWRVLGNLPNSDVGIVVSLTDRAGTVLARKETTISALEFSHAHRKPTVACFRIGLEPMPDGVTAIDVRLEEKVSKNGNADG